MSKANERQVAGDHYRRHGKLQHWDVVNYFNLDYFQGQITKYVMRWKDKNGLEDLHKAQHYLEKYLEIQEAPGEAESVSLEDLAENFQRMTAIQNEFTFEGLYGDGRAMYTCKRCREKVYAVNPIEAFLTHGDCKPPAREDNA